MIMQGYRRYSRSAWTYYAEDEILNNYKVYIEKRFDIPRLWVLLDEKFINAAPHFNVVEYYFMCNAFNWKTST
jgi:hypothetical protein